MFQVLGDGMTWDGLTPPYANHCGRSAVVVRRGLGTTPAVAPVGSSSAPTQLALTASAVAIFSAGFLAGLYLRDRDGRTIPNHPTIRRARERPRLHLVEQPPYDWADEL
jgi:hypothetical protein